MRKVEIGDCTLYHGDSYEILKEIGTDSVTLIHTDPPYLIHSETAKTEGGFVRGFWDKIADADIIDNFDYSIFAEFERILKTPNYQLWCSKKQFPDFLMMAIKNEWRWQDIMLYRKNPTPTTNGKYLDKDYGIHMWSGRKITGEYEDKQTYYVWNVSSNKEWNHPTMKPLGPTEHLIKVGSDAGDFVLDPFMGSGTTGEACVKLGRKFIGIERNEEFFEMSVERLTKAVMSKNNDLTLF